MRQFVGGVIGVLVALALVSVTATIFGVGGVIPGFGWFVSLVLPLVGLLGVGGWLLVGIFALVIFTVFAYVLAAIGLMPGIAATPITTPPTPLPISPLEEVMRGLLIGLAAGMNLGIWTLVPIGAIVGAIVGVVGFLAVFTAVSRTIVYQALLGWLSWIMPMSYLVTPIGIVFFLINLPFALAGAGLAALRFDTLTATVETTGGLSGVTGFRGGFNLGNFTFLATAPGVAPAAVQTPFGAPGLSAHETGHTLTVGAFGGIYGWTNAVDENIPPFRRLALAYGELMPESHFPRGGFTHVREWS
jgi:hypothetical protein